MPSLRTFATVALLLVGPVFALSEPATTTRRATDVPDPETFRELLNAVPEESLHAVLDNHLRPKYQEGVFEYDKAALQRVHEDNPSLASKLVIYAAKLELLKRQSPNATISSTTPDSVSTTTLLPADTSSVEVAPSSTSETPAVTSTPETPITITTTDSGGNTVVVTSSEVVIPETSGASPQSTPTISVEVLVTTTDSVGNIITTSTPRPAVVVSTTNSAGQAIVVTAPSPTLGQAITTTDANGSTFVTTYTPGGGLVSSLVVITSTLPNGDVETITSYAIVGGNPTETATGTNRNPSTTKGSPGLQSGAANVLSRKWGVEAAALVGGAVGVAWLL